jgi:LysM repeat protein
MNKVLIFSLSLLLFGCSSQKLMPQIMDEVASTEVAGEIMSPERAESTPDNMSLVLESSGLVPENASTSFPESTELEQALKNMLSRLVMSPNVSSSERGRWVKGVYHVKKGDTLSAIARDSVQDTEIRPEFMLDAIVKLNPSAFIRGNPNWMLAGSKLNFPKAEDFGKLFFVESEVVNTPTKAVDPFLGWIQYP